MTDLINNDIKILITSKHTGSRLEKINYTDLMLITKKGEIPSLLVDASKVRQKIMGFGGAFTEASASIYSALNEDKKKQIIKAYFSKDIGNAYSFGRTHINSCDFSLGNYAYTETDDDVDLNHFSIEHDRSMLIPFIKDAMKEANEHLKILASPWSPPAWMKSNGEMNNGGKLKKRKIFKPMQCSSTFIFFQRSKMPNQKNKRAFTPKLTFELIEKHWKIKLNGIKPVYNNV